MTGESKPTLYFHSDAMIVPNPRISKEFTIFIVGVQVQIKCTWWHNYISNHGDGGKGYSRTK